MSTLKQMIEQLDQALNEKHAHYIELHKELDKHRGKELDETNMPEVQKILGNIQDTFADIYNVFHFIMYRHQLAQNSTREYNEFIDELKKHMIVEEEAKA